MSVAADLEQYPESVTMAWEAATGYDSVRTIERLYDQTKGGAYVCVFPGCAFARRDALALWKHVHSAHGESSMPPDDFDWKAYW